MLDNLPRLRISDALLKVFLWILREAGVKDVPSFNAFRTMQQQLRAGAGISTIQCQSPQGNVFYLNDPRELIAKDWANPLVRPEMQLYPEIPQDGIIREIWHTEKWHTGMDPTMLSPMYDAGDTHYYVNEWAQLHDGRIILPRRWVIFKGAVHAEAHVINNQVCTRDMGRCRRSNVSFDDLLSSEGCLTSLSPLSALECELPPMPNPLRAIAGGDPLYTSFIDHFGDDVSGNRSKSWNKHWNTYMTHRNLPRRLLQQEFHMHFISTSPHASVVEQFHHLQKIIKLVYQIDDGMFICRGTHQDPVRVRDAMSGKMIRFRIFVNAEPSDNPMQSELSGHIGGGGNLFCRKCEVGGPDADKVMDQGFHALFEPGVPRSKTKVLAEVKLQLSLACRGVEAHVRNRQTLTGVKDSYTQFWIDQLIQRSREMKREGRSVDDVQRELVEWVDKHEDEVYNPCFMLPGLDPTTDTPIEILHTILLGIVKYTWHGTHTSWDAKQKALYAQRLQATSTAGLSVDAIRAKYIMQYANSLIGRQLKTVVQASAFHVYDLALPLQFELWKAVGNLTALLWFPEIRDLETYLDDVDTEVANVLDIFAEIDPSKVLEKIKLHLLVHLRQDIARFGPPIGVASESFECFNGVFRQCSILSNHLSPSRDIARQLGDLAAHKHRLTGCWWPAGSGEWVQASPAVRDFLQRQPALQRLLGWTPESLAVAGAFRLAPVPRGQASRPQMVFRLTSGSTAVNAAEYDPDGLWNCCREITTSVGDPCREGTWVCARSPTAPATNILGRASELLAACDSDAASAQAIVVLDVFEVAATRHPKLGMPWLVQRHDEPLKMVVPSKSLLFSFNVQHDCAFANCSASGRQPVMQERLASGVFEETIEHQAAVQQFIINMHSLHNPHLVRSILPRSLTAPIQRHEDRVQAHSIVAAELRQIKKRKRALALAHKDAQKAAASKPPEVSAQAPNAPSSIAATSVPSMPGPSTRRDSSIHQGAIVPAAEKHHGGNSTSSAMVAAPEPGDIDENYDSRITKRMRL
ncbi:hypothetical protein FKP32DRAFT_1654775 [Trametes sanguinea]|nr:hypothetical protein FKP32DRAFT_1654775 [Trametes sanguinea]